MNSPIVVTGAAGFIGGQTALKFKAAGYQVVGIDRRPCPERLQDAFYRFVQSDVVDFPSQAAILHAHSPAIIHCAGSSLVGPSIKNPGDYYENNVFKTMQLMDYVRKVLPETRIIFSSSAATYGEPVMSPCHEVDPCDPINPYGDSKYMSERMMAAYRTAYNLDYVAFRYFNATGADPQARHGQDPGATHIIARVLESIRDNKQFTLFGVDYPTEDGTCVRDYIHIDDIADAHILALDQKVEAGVYNLSTNHGVSNLEIIHTAERITGKKLDMVRSTQPRGGDPAVLVGNPAKFDRVVGDWRKYQLDDIIQHVWNWYVRQDPKV